MLFYPVRFKGTKIPGLRSIVWLMPRKIQQIPGVMHGGIGWQGIIPSRAAKMGSIAVDKGIAKVGSPSDPGAVREDEWLLYLHGAVLGFDAGLLHLALSR